MEKIVLMNCDDLPNAPLVMEKSIGAGQSFSLHWHDYFELEIILSGSAEHTHNQKKYIATAGNAYLLSYYDFHSFKAITDTKIIGIRFDESVLPEELINYISVSRHHFNCMYSKDELDDVIAQIEKIKREQHEGQRFSRQIIVGALSELMISIIRKTGVEPKTTTPLLVQQSILYLVLHFRDENISLHLVADELHVSANYLGHLFRTATGVTFREYLNTLRIKYACRLLLSTELSLTEVAYASGYKTNEHFFRTFKQVLAVSPGEYRCSASEKSVQKFGDHTSCIADFQRR